MKWHSALGALKVELFDGKPKQYETFDSFYIYTACNEYNGEISAQKEP